MSRLVLIRGLPGSGKSTLARQHALVGFLHLEADQFFMQDGVYVYDAARIGEAHSWCLCQCIDALAAGRSVVVANTFTRRYELASYLAVARVLRVTAEIIITRGSWLNVHDVPEEKIAAMRERWEE